ncbi:hypothetical protein TST_0761 [Thermosulfidibacter takaii ABI70S6]|uniref:Uncharacterized protein n=1 Tax=Thermosulfidibacter takaii (strain DSM 17441 / JCM 13301 / NBRC 103674 / ABI70S6) TaxID=1298851 RepID=A0A0S3QTB0_THET7|nr:hypothetical protein TST_0761 [Thermosulfidibacter takaii ABI70S6]
MSASLTFIRSFLLLAEGFHAMRFKGTPSLKSSKSLTSLSASQEFLSFSFPLLLFIFSVNTSPGIGCGYTVTSAAFCSLCQDSKLGGSNMIGSLPLDTIMAFLLKKKGKLEGKGGRP